MNDGNDDDDDDQLHHQITETSERNYTERKTLAATRTKSTPKLRSGRDDGKTTLATANRKQKTTTKN